MTTVEFVNNIEIGSELSLNKEKVRRVAFFDLFGNYDEMATFIVALANNEIKATAVQLIAQDLKKTLQLTE